MRLDNIIPPISTAANDNMIFSIDKDDHTNKMPLIEKDKDLDQKSVIGQDNVDYKSVFCCAYVIPQTARAAKYITLYRRLCREGCLVQYSTAF